MAKDIKFKLLRIGKKQVDSKGFAAGVKLFYIRRSANAEKRSGFKNCKGHFGRVGKRKLMFKMKGLGLYV